MTGVRFKDWETFLRYVGSQEKMKHKEEWRKATELWDMDDLEPGEWKGMEKILSPSNYEELAMRLGTVEVRSFRLPFESDGMIIYAAGKEEGDGGYFCMGYGFVEENETNPSKSRYVPLPVQKEGGEIVSADSQKKSYADFLKEIMRKNMESSHYQILIIVMLITVLLEI